MPGLVIAALPWMAVLCVLDLRQHRLPNWLTLPGALVIIGVAALGGHVYAALAGGLSLAALYLVIHLISPQGMGAGDVKLALGTGALTGTFGAATWFLGALAAPVLTIGAGLLAAALARVRSAGASSVASPRRIRLPHGPSMCAAAVLAVVIAMAAGE